MTWERKRLARMSYKKSSKAADCVRATRPAGSSDSVKRPTLIGKIPEEVVLSSNSGHFSHRGTPRSSKSGCTPMLCSG